MARRTGGQLNTGTGRVEKGPMPRGSVEVPMTIKEGPLRIFRRKGK